MPGKREKESSRYEKKSLGHRLAEVTDGGPFLLGLAAALSDDECRATAGPGCKATVGSLSTTTERIRKYSVLR